MATVEEDRLKEILKIAIVEVLEERRDLVRDLIEEAMEDVGLSRAIAEGANSGSVSRNQIFAILDGSE
jgi:hypothetical protein